MKKFKMHLLLSLILVHVIILAALLSAQQTDPESAESVSFQVPQIGIIDVLSSSFEEADRNMFTDILRTEIFKINYFKIIERGMIQQILSEHEISMSGLVEDSELLQIGRFLAVEKLLICKIEKFADTVAINLRVIDVNTSLLDFTENVFINDENQIFNALRDLVIQLEIFYVQRSSSLKPEDRVEYISVKWKSLGADDQGVNYLLNENVDPKEYMEIRQYDITFTVSEFIELRRSGWDAKAVKTFFQAGIPFDQVKRALDFGIADLSSYNETFKPADLSFNEYLDAFENHIVSPADYREFRKGYDKEFLVFGLGGVADSLPVINADFSFFFLNAGWEHYLTDYQRDLWKYSMEMGLFFMQGFIPTPYFQANVYAGDFPFYGKIAIGVFGEVFVGGHFGVYARGGMELNNMFDFSVIATFWGTQPKVSYADLETKRGEEGYGEIVFPYVGAFLTYKIRPYALRRSK